MGKSAVLKDLSNHVAGYVVLSGENVLCRVQLSVPSELAVVFSDGTSREYALSADKMEQRFPCKEKNMCGCYVFQNKELLLISDERMRSAFERHSACTEAPCKTAPDCEPVNSPSIDALPEENEKSKRAFAQRRWPPPPCWETACYRNGCWQEE